MVTQNSRMLLSTFLAIIMVIVIAGCTAPPQKPINDIAVPGHDRIYTFSNDIRSSIKIKVANESDIYRLVRTERDLTIVFNGSNEDDNGMFRVALFDLSGKLPFYLASEGKTTILKTYFFLDEWNGTQWYNATGEPISPPQFDGAILWLKGPATGASETSVTLEGKTIVLQGTTHKNISLAADKLTLVAFGIANLSDIRIPESSEPGAEPQKNIWDPVR